VERNTIHIADDSGRIALLEKRTHGSASADNNTNATLTRYCYNNHIQSCSLELDDKGLVISYEEYHPYGTTSYSLRNAAINATAKRYRFTGKERDEESGFNYHSARYYLPWLGRWCAVDALESEFAGSSNYNYGHCNPVMLNDLDGKCPGGGGGKKQVAQTPKAETARTNIGSWYKDSSGVFHYLKNILSEEQFLKSGFNKDGNTWLGESHHENFMTAQGWDYHFLDLNGIEQITYADGTTKSVEYTPEDVPQAEPASVQVKVVNKPTVAKVQTSSSAQQTQTAKKAVATKTPAKPTSVKNPVQNPTIAKGVQPAKPKAVPVANVATQSSASQVKAPNGTGGGAGSNGGVGQPGTLESMIPIWGSGRAAVDDFQNGNYGWAAFHTAMAISDVFLVKSIATGIGKGAWKLGSHSWSATRKWLGKNGYAESGQHVHHWAVHQATAKRYGLEAVTNQPWNLMPMPSATFHRALHGYGNMNIAERMWYGTPTWFKAGLFSGGGRIID
jgi:RHS repeat-associated protein